MKKSIQKKKSNESKVAAAAAALGKVRTHLNASFPEREEVVELLLTAAVGGEHLVMLGIPGTGKSAIARAFAGCLHASFYEYLFTPFSAPDEFIGPLSMKALENDEYRRNLTGRFADSDVVFGDEIFKSNSAALNTLLPVLNERLVHNGPKPTPVPLRVCVAASNEMPAGDELGALWDRFLLRVEVQPLKSTAARERLMSGDFDPKAEAACRPSISMSELDVLCDAVSSVGFDAFMSEKLQELRVRLESNGIVYGDRRWVKAVKLLRANALVNGETEVDLPHFSILRSMLWNTPEHRPEVLNQVGLLSGPEVQRAQKMFDDLIADIRQAEVDGKVEDFGGCLSACVTAHDEIKRSVENSKSESSKRSLQKILSQISEEHQRLTDEIQARFMKQLSSGSTL